MESVHTDGTASTASQSMLDKIEINFAIQPPLQALLSNIYFIVISEIFYYAIQIYFMHYVVYTNLAIAELICLLEPCVELICRTLAKATIQGNQSKLLDSLFQR